MLKNPANVNYGGAPQNILQMKSTGNLFVTPPIQTNSNTQSHVLQTNISNFHNQVNWNQPIRKI